MQKRRVITPKWKFVSTDDGWVDALLSWHSEQNPTCDFVSLETNLQPSRSRRANTHEVLHLDGNVLTSSETGEVLCLYNVDNERTLQQAVQTTKMDSNKTLQYRFSDGNLRQTAPFGYFFQLVGECLPLERANVSRACMQIFNQQVDIPVGATIRVEFGGQFVAQVLYGKQVLCQTKITFSGPLEKRYDVTRITSTSRLFLENAVRTRNLSNVPVRRIIRPFQFELDPALLGYCFLTETSLGIAEILDHIFPPGSVLDSNGNTVFTFFWRTANVQVFDMNVRCSNENGGMLCESWVDRTGKSSCDLRVDFFLPSNPGVIVAATRLTIVNMTLPEKRPTKMFHDQAWAEARYLYGKSSPVAAQSFAINPPSATSWSSPAYGHTLVLRESDQDSNGHINSGRYLCLVEDAKHAAMQAGYLPVVTSATTTKYYIEYNKEMHLDSQHSALIKVAFQQSSDGGVLWITFDFFNHASSNDVCTSVVMEISMHAAPRNRL